MQSSPLFSKHIMVGTLPGIFIMESLVDYVAKSLNLNVEQVKLANLYQQGQVRVPDVWML